VHLKSLTLKGFKSFASATTLRFEPGITCVVGPNGSGKSNVVDAIAWVLGEQGAKALRGGKMEDVIFAGTPGRAALGRAEVTLTIDNGDGALPIDYAEVSIRRLMFRSGESEYAINGSRCRLVDVQELMSDSGIGRELHVVVGQGQLDAVLAARPEDRRGFIEEAAGVLKHRKRKERALRKLDAMSANLSRLSDLSSELRRQLGPLGRQAQVARRAGQVQADLRDARLRLLADDLQRAAEALGQVQRDDAAARARRDHVEAAHAEAGADQERLELAAAAQAPELARAQDGWYRLSALHERLRATGELADQRARHLGAALAPPSGDGRAPEQLETEAARVREEQNALSGELEQEATRLADSVATRTSAEADLAAQESALTRARRARADRREGLARLTGQVGALRSRAAATEAERGRLDAALVDAGARAEQARAEHEALVATAGGLDAGEVDLDARHERAEQARAEAQQALEALVADDREAERQRSTALARREALATALPRDGAVALLTGTGLTGSELTGSGLTGSGLTGSGVTGSGDDVLGALATLVTVTPGSEAAIAAALGAAADAVVVRTAAAAGAALRRLKDDDAGRAALLVADAQPEVATTSAPPAGRWARELVDCEGRLAAALDRALSGVVVVSTLEQAAALVHERPDLRAVTTDGDLLGSTYAAGGSASAPSRIEVQAAVDEAEAAAQAAGHRQERLRFELARLRADAQARSDELEAALAALHDSDAAMAALAEQLGLLASAVRAAEAEAGRLEQSRDRAGEAATTDLIGLEALEQRLAAAEAAVSESWQAEDEPSTAARDAAADAAGQARAAEVEVRLSVRTGEERLRALAGRAAGLERAAAEQRAAQVRFAQRQVRRAAAAQVAAQVAAVAKQAAQRAAASVELAAARRQQAAAERAATDEQLASVRTCTRELAAELERLTGAVHRDELAQAEQWLRVEVLEQRAREEWAVTPEQLLAEHGPQLPVPARREDGEIDPDVPAAPYERAVQEKRAAAAERALAQLGRVNPLALEEFAALEERSAFLSTQLEDLKATRRDLLDIVRDVDARIHEVFADAFADTAREFAVVFSTLFPGGEGSLVLTDPDDLLTTGIEVLARPAGKRVSRLSLLSGGERSLTALAFLVALFRARPSPFYVLDEVEAALDDRNLSRLLELLGQLREASQLVVITHQKRTMEIADALYGVTMRGDGISAVVSQRLREPAVV